MTTTKLTQQQRQNLKMNIRELGDRITQERLRILDAEDRIAELKREQNKLNVQLHGDAGR